MASKEYSRFVMNGELSQIVGDIGANLKSKENKFFYTDEKNDKCYQIKFSREKRNNRQCLVAEVKWNDIHNNIKYPKYLENLFLSYGFEEASIWTVS